MAGRFGAVLWVLGPVVYLVLEAIAAAAFGPAYSYADNYISDLGVAGPDRRLMHVAFCWQGITLLLGAGSITGRPGSGRAHLFLGLAVANAVGNCLVGIFHRGMLHGTGAVLAIVGGNAAILAGWALVNRHGWYPRVSKLVAALGFLCFAGFVSSLSVQSMPKGAWERGSVYSILLWQLLTAFCVLRRRAH